MNSIMNYEHEKIPPLTVKKLLSEGRYCIPIYQRNYDWGEREALQLLEDVADYASRGEISHPDYYIGSVVVFVRLKDGEEYFETIDGQQRLTTLTILKSVINSIATEEERDEKEEEKEEKTKVRTLLDGLEKVNIFYEHRHEADEAIRNLGRRQSADNSSAVNIYDVYNIMKKNIASIVSDKSLKLSEFVDYLLNHVIIMRVPVPRDTELNHYFEIMNSRGEQLEKHEVLKAKLMNYLPQEAATVRLYNELWEACSDMTKYVQMKMRTDLRSIIFSPKWDHLLINDFDELLGKYTHIADTKSAETEVDGYMCRSLEKLFDDARQNTKYYLPNDDSGTDGGNERFGSVINFPNFLLQTLNVMYRAENKDDKEVDSSIALDDKQLIIIFQRVLNQYTEDEQKGLFAKRFIMALLRMRFLFDKYVIKRENHNNREGWSLKCLKLYDKSKVNYVATFPQKKKDNEYEVDDEEENDIGKDIRMLEAMFHVSAPTQIYKNWLNAILYYLYFIKGREEADPTIDPSDMRTYLYELACKYMRYQYLTANPSSFEDIIYNGESLPMPSDNPLDWRMINLGCNVKNFIFNFYDYIVWKKEYPRRYKNFEFTYRTSVEHFYPQTPLNGNSPLKEDVLNSFGNLCLISRGMNSKFSNNMPEAKVNNFGNEEVVKELSIKLNEMMNVVRESTQKEKWGEKEIKDFEEMAIKRLSSALLVECS